MVNVHLNGDITRGPDVREYWIQRYKNQKDNICKYGIDELLCPAWFNKCNADPEVKKISDYGHCNLCTSDECPMRKIRRERGSMIKTFEIKNKDYRQISSSAHYLVKTSDYKTLFLTLTFPNFKRYVTDKEINEYFSRFVENLRKRHDCSGYIAVREHGFKRGRVHFHLLISIPFIPFPVLNSIWCNTISDICHFSKNAVTSDPKTRFIHNPQRAMRYVCKYFAKCKGQKSESRLIFVSHNINIKHKSFDQRDGIAPFTIAELHDRFNSITVCQTSEYTTAFRINDNKEFQQFCEIYLYKLFNIEAENSYLYSFPTEKY